jgi:glycosyltransferase involved in cell wall biosynthesis
MSARPRVTVVSLVLPHERAPSAGGRYVHELHRLLVDTGHQVTFVVPDTPRNRAAAGSPGTPSTAVLAGAWALGGPRALRTRALQLLDGRTRFARRGRLPLLTVAAMRTGPARTAVADADVVDLQWTQTIRLLPLVRRLNPRARVVGTFHDVQSQAFARRPAPGPPRHGYWSLVARSVRRDERRLAAALDEAVVFSAKDAALLGDPPRCRVVHPPLAAPGPPPVHRPPARPRVLMVSYLARPENDEAAHRMLGEVWPRVRAAVPDATLRLVGAGADDRLLARAAACPGVETPGFVDDLTAEYADATAVVVPLRRGAGVKFKTVEALLHGVPVVTTPVGAEGIGRDDLYATCSAGGGDLVDGLVAVLRDPAGATRRAVEAQRWAAATYGHDQFREGVLSGYGTITGMGD